MKPSVLVARAVFPDVVDRLREYFEVEDNPADEVFDKSTEIYAFIERCIAIERDG